jgi:hypothetical protein
MGPSVRSAVVPSWKRATRGDRGRANAERGHLVTPPRPAGLSLRDEKILLTLVVQTQQINDRLTRLEDRVDASIRDAMEQPDQQDLLELRMHSARLAAELSRVTVELRAEINELAAGLSGATGADDILRPRHGDDDEPHDRPSPGPDDPEPVIDLRDETGRASAPRASGWRPARATRHPRDDR